MTLGAAVLLAALVQMLQWVVSRRGSCDWMKQWSRCYPVGSDHVVNESKQCKMFWWSDRHKRKWSAVLSDHTVNVMMQSKIFWWPGGPQTISGSLILKMAVAVFPKAENFQHSTQCFHNGCSHTLSSSHRDVQCFHGFAASEVLMAVAMKSLVLWVVTACSLERVAFQRNILPLS
jgi:hypothetical protein